MLSDCNGCECVRGNECRALHNLNAEHIDMNKKQKEIILIVTSLQPNFLLVVNKTEESGLAGL